MLIRYLFVVVFTLAPTIAYADGDKKEYIWLDDVHKSIADSVNISAQWFDDFFINELGGENSEAKGEARIRLGWQPRTRDLSDVEARLKVRVKLPKLKNRVDLILSDYDDEIEENTVAGSRIDDISRQDRFNLALQFKRSPDSGLSHRLGVGRRFQVYAKSRYRQTIDINDNSEFRWEASIYYYNRDGFGSDVGMTYDYHFTEKSLFRFDNRFYYRDKTNDWLWQHSWQQFTQLDSKTAVIYGLYVEGLSQPHYQMEEYLVSVRWRQNTLREWLFYDIEPFVVWRRDEQFSPSFGIALQLEGYFGKY